MSKEVDKAVGEGKTCWVVWQGYQVFDVVDTEEEAKAVIKMFSTLKLTKQETLDDFRNK